ncbi:MAG: hypothetical protein ACUZ77_10300 [Candidatus Brocadiales bacterium]
MKTGTNFNELLESIDQLSDEEQEMLTDIIRNRLHERRREEIAQNARETYEALKEGRAKTGTIDDLKRDLTE